MRSRVPEGYLVIALWMIPESELAVASMQSTRFVGLARVVFDLSRCPQWHGAELRTHPHKNEAVMMTKQKIRGARNGVSEKVSNAMSEERRA